MARVLSMQDADKRREADELELEQVAPQPDVYTGNQQRHGRARPGIAARRAR